jgi:hypothetical protein
MFDAHGLEFVVLVVAVGGLAAVVSEIVAQGPGTIWKILTDVEGFARGSNAENATAAAPGRDAAPAHAGGLRQAA